LEESKEDKIDYAAILANNGNIDARDYLLDNLKELGHSEEILF